MFERKPNYGPYMGNYSMKITPAKLLNSNGEKLTSYPILRYIEKILYRHSSVRPFSNMRQKNSIFSHPDQLKTNFRIYFVLTNLEFEQLFYEAKVANKKWMNSSTLFLAGAFWNKYAKFTVFFVQQQTSLRIDPILQSFPGGKVVSSWLNG